MADIRMPLNTQGRRSIVKISVTGYAVPVQTIKAIRMQKIPVCVTTAAITGFRSFLLFLENVTAIIQAKGLSDKNSTLYNTSLICSMGHPLTNLVSNFSMLAKKKTRPGKMIIVERQKSLRKRKPRMTSGSIRETNGCF